MHVKCIVYSMCSVGQTLFAVFLVELCHVLVRVR